MTDLLAAGLGRVFGKPAVSLDDRLRAAGYRPSGFDYLRIVLACSVIVGHSWSISYGEAVGLRLWNSPLSGIMQMVLPMFFVLSGFLVAASLERCRTILGFMALRAMRIFPALAAATLLAALVIGPLVTRLPPRDYFTDPLLGRYLVNMTGLISYRLPGVFETNPMPAIVNLQLWTVPWELIGYVALVGLVLMGLKKHPSLVALGFVVCLIADAFIVHANGGLGRTLWVYHAVQSGGKLLALFLVGAAGWFYRARIPYSRRLFWPCLVGSAMAFYCVPAAQYLTMLPVGYATLYIGLSNPRRIGLVGLANLSYGVYLYGWLMQQLVADVLPGAREWYWNIALALPLSLLAALLSWYAVEKPVFRLRRRIRALEEGLLALRRRGASDSGPEAAPAPSPSAPRS